MLGSAFTKLRLVLSLFAVGWGCMIIQDRKRGASLISLANLDLLSSISQYQ